MVKINKVATVLLACSMFVAAQASFAHPREASPRHGGERHHHYRPDHRADYRHARPHRAPRPHYSSAPRRPAAGFHHGRPLPRQYWAHQYRVDDWRRHGLRRPPRGYRWVQIDGDFILIAAATGVIASILLNQ